MRGLASVSNKYDIIGAAVGWQPTVSVLEQLPVAVTTKLSVLVSTEG